MKKVVLSAVILTAVLMSATAQTKKAMPVKTAQMSSMDMSSPTAKGKWLIGPALSISSDSDDDGTTTTKETKMGFQSEIGYFISDDLSVGLGLAFGMQKSKVDGVDDNKASVLFVLPTLRYYMPITSKFKFLGKLQVPVGSIKNTLQNGNAIDVKTTNFGVQVIPAFAFFPSNKISIEMTLGSLYFDSSKTGEVKTTSLGLDILNDNDHTAFITGPTLGVKWHLGK